MTKFYKFMATGFGSGYSPFAPGTAGALVGCGIFYFLHSFYPSYFPGFGTNALYFLTLILIFLLIGVRASYKLEPEWGEDPSKIVIDEIVGMWITLLFIPFSLLNLFIGFILFRLFDIFKPLYIRRAESMGMGWGVMMDDVAAGIYANICLQIIIRFI